MADIVLQEDQTVDVPSEVLAYIDAKAMEFVEKSKAPNTVRSYRADWNHFTEWCTAHGLEYLPTTPATVARYLAAHAEQLKTSTLQRRLSAISQAHKQAGFAPISTRDEPLHSVWEGIRRVKGTAQRGKAPAVIDDIRAMVNTLSNNLLGIRDRALILVGFAGAFRRSELVSLNVEDVEFTRDGLIVHLRRSKTDQEGHGRDVGIPYGSNPKTCPVRALQDWLKESGIESGPLFRSVNRHGQIQSGRLSDKAVALVVKRAAEAAGLDASKYAGHSLRAGLATTAANAGVSERAIMAQTGHKSVTMVRKYIRQGSLFVENAAASVGL
jgi:site-specific recombinase XerD